MYPDDEAVFRWLRAGAPGRVRCIEAEVMDLSDDIAYSVHDFEDAVVNGYLDPTRLADVAEHDALLTAIQAWVGFDFARDELADALYRLMRLPEWIASFNGTRADHARLKNLTSDLIGRFARAATSATREAYGLSTLTRYRAHVIVPRVVEAEMAVLKGIIGAVVVSIEGRKALYKEQRRVLRRLASALWEQPDALDALYAEDFAVATTDAARRRVVVDQVASLTDQLAIAWHGRLVGEIDAASIGVWAPGASRPGHLAARSPSRRGTDGRAHPAGRRRRGEGPHEHRRHHRRAGRPQIRRSRRDEGTVPLPRRAQPELQRARAGGLLPLLRLRRVRRRVLLPPGHGPRVLHRGRRAAGRADRLHAALRGRRGRSREHRSHAGCTPPTRQRRSSSASQLPTAEADIARRFLGERGFDAGAAAHFGVGFAPKGWSAMLDALTAQGFTRDELISSGLVSQGQRGVYDRFRGRVVWPIRDVTGQVIGFGARRLFDDDNGPKYLNTPETPLYKKAGVLYGLDLAKREISRSHRVVVVEGYTDVMACHLAGVTTAIATCGTAFGSDHITALRRVMGDDSTAGEVVFTFDPDAAGQKAAIRAFAEAKRFNAQTYVAVGPDGLDPCDLRLRRGDGAVRTIVDEKVPMVEFVLDQRITGYDLASVEGRVGALRSSAPVVAELRDPLLQPEYVRVLARRLGMDTEDVRREVERAGRGARHGSRGRGRTGRRRLRRRADRPRDHAIAAAHGRSRARARRADGLPAVRASPRPRAATAGGRPAVPASGPRRRAERRRGRPGPGPARMGGGRRGDRARAVPLAGRRTAHLGLPGPRRRPRRRLGLRSRPSPHRPDGLDQEKSELLGAIQRVPPDSDEGRRIRIRLRELDAQRQRLVLDS